MAKWQENIDDVLFIVDDVNRFASMTFEQFKEHIEAHPEDKLHALIGVGRFRIGRDAALRFHALAKRLLDVGPSKHDVDVGTLDDAIRAAFLHVFVKHGKQVDRKSVDSMLARAIKEAKKIHQAKTHYIPCVVMTHGHPPEFAIGPVRFISRDKFLSDYEQKIVADYWAGDEERKAELDRLISEGKHAADRRPSDEEMKRNAEMEIGSILGYYKEFVWIAEVAVPPCDEHLSRERAETTVQGALDVLKLFFGCDGGEDFRMSYERGQPDKTARLTREPDGKFEWSLGWHGEGAAVEKCWYDKMIGDTGWAVGAAGSAIEEYLRPEAVKSAHRDRWLGALSWYGQAVSERLPSARIVKFVAALERLTVTPEAGKQDVTDVVTRRTALLGVEEYTHETLREARADARKVYNWRSNLMHGRSSPLTKELVSVMYLADRLAQQALFVALAQYVELDRTGRGKSKDLEERFTELERELPPEGPAPPTANMKRLAEAAEALSNAKKRIRSKAAGAEIDRALALVEKLRSVLR